MKLYKSKNKLVITNRYGKLIVRLRRNIGQIVYELYRCGHLVRQEGPNWIPSYVCNRHVRTTAKALVNQFCSSDVSVLEASAHILEGPNKGAFIKVIRLRPSDLPLPKNETVNGIETTYRLLA